MFAFDETTARATRSATPRRTRDGCRSLLLNSLDEERRRAAIARTGGHWPFPPVIPTPMPIQDLEVGSPFRLIGRTYGLFLRAPSLLAVVAVLAIFVA